MDDQAAASSLPDVAVIGGGPAGLMAAERLSLAGRTVHVFDAMPSVGRKFLMAGKGGLNLTHSEPLDRFLDRYGARRPEVEPWLRAFDPDAIRAWAAALGTETFIGTSGRVFPVDFKAAPLLRAWIRRLREAGVVFHVRHRWIGWDASGALQFVDDAARAQKAGAQKAGAQKTVTAPAVVLALGGASWPRLGSNAAWVPVLEARGVRVAPFRPANCGFDVAWPAWIVERFAGNPIKAAAFSFGGTTVRGEAVVTQTGIEGGPVYALSAALRDSLERGAGTELLLDLLPNKDVGEVAALLRKPRGARSLSNHLRRTVGIEGVKAALLRFSTPPEAFDDPVVLAQTMKALPIPLLSPRPIAEAISSAGGVMFSDLDSHLMLRSCPGVFCVGEMLDWEAPTGGYLLSACLASGYVAGEGVLAWIDGVNDTKQ